MKSITISGVKDEDSVRLFVRETKNHTSRTLHKDDFNKLVSNGKVELPKLSNNAEILIRVRSMNTVSYELITKNVSTNIEVKYNEPSNEEYIINKPKFVDVSNNISPKKKTSFENYIKNV